MDRWRGLVIVMFLEWCWDSQEGINREKEKGRGGILPKEARKDIPEKKHEIGGVVFLTTQVLRTLNFVPKKNKLCSCN